MYGGAGLYPSNYFGQGGQPEPVEVDSTSSAVSTPSTVTEVPQQEAA